MLHFSSPHLANSILPRQPVGLVAIPHINIVFTQSSRLYPSLRVNHEESRPFPFRSPASQLTLLCHAAILGGSFPYLPNICMCFIAPSVRLLRVAASSRFPILPRWNDLHTTYIVEKAKKRKSLRVYAGKKRSPICTPACMQVRDRRSVVNISSVGKCC
jgi:hypothetical protein